MFIVNICRQKMQDLKQRKGRKRARIAAAAKRVVHFVLCSTDVSAETVERSFDGTQAASSAKPLVDEKPEASVVATNVADVQPRICLDVTMDGVENYNAPNPGMLAAAEEIRSVIDINTYEDRFDAAPICATPRLSLFATASDSDHGKVTNLKDLSECLDAIWDAYNSTDNVCSGESSVCVAVDMSSNMAMLERETRSMIDINICEDRFDAVPICTTPRLSLFATASDFDHGEVANLKDLSECLDAICDAYNSTDNVCSGESSVCVAVDTSSNMAMAESDDFTESMKDIMDIFAGNAYFDDAPIEVMSYQSLNAIASNFNNKNSGDYHDSDNSDVNIENVCSDLSSTYVMSDGASDIIKVDDSNSEKQLVLALAKAMDEQFFDRSLMENFSPLESSTQYGANKAMSFVAVELPMSAGSIEDAGWTHDLSSWVFSAASTVAHAFNANAN
ncbi:hypothetical protein COEREDRAFT_87058 [Coemansia reversa NRRL 1564]|uniref:Uncharacterized protein n=1 Tax=Coemansia reversa (strain ATCC 12441 / NRRL 1564) TaxID=763665 RepID=A0A2G5BBH0_COERN|nr:hypothetical protein COEREDRAFT_87058 [Coemansia reversa NRRL 1564]|eukprot:PIA16350.1 hypothetical protein COEREDRAFT_87058 [Coemansia reversa NRRL 1564]